MEVLRRQGIKVTHDPTLALAISSDTVAECHFPSPNVLDPLHLALSVIFGQVKRAGTVAIFGEVAKLGSSLKGASHVTVARAIHGDAIGIISTIPASLHR